MMGPGFPGRNERPRGITAHAHVEQSIAMQVAEFPAFEPEFDAAEPMHFRPPTGPPQGRGFKSFHRRQTRPMRHRSPRQQRGIENLRQTGPARQPAQMPHDQAKNHPARSACSRTFSMTRRCTARKMERVHLSKYQSGRTCSTYQVRPISVVVPS